MMEEKDPTLIENKEELKENLQKLEKLEDDYFNTNNATLKNNFTYFTKFIRLGHCFVAYKVADEWRFVPSRFVGYKERIPEFVQLLRGQYDKEFLNSLHDGQIDGRETNKRITEILKQKLITKDNALWENLEEEYKKYCKKLQIKPYEKIDRKYWIFGDVAPPIRISEDEKEDEEYYEGRAKEAKYLKRDRNRKVIEKKKEEFKKQHGSIYCEACGFDFGKTYGEIGEGFIEVHHITPISEMSPEGEEVKLKDLVLLCSNCHRMIHRRRNKMLTIDELKKILKK